MQVGKTYSLLEFGRKHYENVVYLNFETNPSLIDIFNKNIDPSYIIPLLSNISNKTIIKERTLIILFEVQLCKRALASLKYFYENTNEYHIVVAGSLLGVAINRYKFSFPIGKVDILTLYPMDIEEFMSALSEDSLIDLIEKSFLSNKPLPSARHEKALKIYRTYLIVGCMPKCTKQYIETNDFLLVRHSQEMILVNYLNDMSKYNNLNEIKKTKLT